MQEFTHLNNRIHRRITAIAATAAFMALLLPFSVLASSITALDGCINTDQLQVGFEYIRLTAPTCEFTLELDEGEFPPVVTIENANPFEYSVYQNGTEQAITQDGDTIQFTAQIETATPTTYAVRPWTASHEQAQTNFTFAALADTQTKPGGSDPNPVFSAIAQHVATLSVPFMTISGDLIGGHVASAQEHANMYDRYDTVIDAITAPTFSVPGDHDTRQPLDDYYTPRYGERFYSFHYQGATFIGINSVESLEAEGEFSEDDLVTVESLLSDAQEADSAQTIVFMHHPIIPPEWASSQGIDESQRLQLAQLFIDYGVDLLLVGDAHGYDDNLLTSDDLPGLDGTVRQLTIGGAGGNMANFEGQHFFMLITVTDDSITYERVQYDAVGVTYTVDGSNNGSAASIEVVVENPAEQAVEHARIPFHLQTEHAYAIDQDGTFYETTTHVGPSGTTRGFIDTQILELSETTFTIGAQTTARLNSQLTVHTNGEMSFSTLPSSAGEQTTVSVEQADNEYLLEVSQWSAEDAQYKWNTELPNNAAYDSVEATYSIAGLQPQTEYTLWKDNKLYKRLISESEGFLTITAVHDAENSFELVQRELAPVSVGALPATEGGAQFRDIETGDNDLHAFFVYNESKEKSAESIWADVDGDAQLELVTYAAEGESVPLRVYEVDGTMIDSLYPFASDYSKGYSVDVGDIDADGDDEIVIARKGGNKKSIVRVFDVTQEDRQLRQIESFRAMGKNYRGGTSVAVADINGDGDAEIITGTRTNKSTVRVYKWLHKKGAVKQWYQRKPHAGANADSGVVFATADMDSDGREDVIVGSATGNGFVRMYGYSASASKLRQIGKGHTFSKKLRGGVQLHTGNVNSGAQMELLVTPAGQRKFTGQVRVVQLNTATQKASIVGRKAAFGKGVSGGIDMTTADVDGDGIEEIAVSRRLKSGLIAVLKAEDSKFPINEYYRPYSRAFAGGLFLTK